MNTRSYFIPSVSFESLATDEKALAAFATLLRSCADAGWNVTKAEETEEKGLKGLTLTMSPV